MSSLLPRAMEDLIKVFYFYSGREGDKYKLNKRELKNMFQQEFGVLLDKSTDPKEVENIMQGLDNDGDGEVDFKEFVALVLAITFVCNEFFLECNKS